MWRHCIALRNLMLCFLPNSWSVARSMAVLSSSLRGFSNCDEPSLTISSRQVSGVRRALTRSSPLSECGFGSPRLTSLKSACLVRYLRSLLAESTLLSSWREGSSEVKPSLAVGQFLDQRPRFIQAAQRHQHAARMDGDVASLLIGIDEVAHQPVAVAVEV